MTRLHCGSRLFDLDGDGVEIRTGAPDHAPNGLAPAYEIWIRQREAWLPALPETSPWDEDRFPADDDGGMPARAGIVAG